MKDLLIALFGGADIPGDLRSIKHMKEAEGLFWKPLWTFILLMILWRVW